MGMSKRIAYFTNIAPHYREKLWFELAGEPGLEFNFFFGSSQKGIKAIDFSKQHWEPNQSRLHGLKNIRVKGRLVFQRGVLSKVVSGKWDAIIFLGDVNIISNWLAVVVAYLRGIPIIFWGHGLYGCERGLNKQIRLFFLSQANAHLVYGEWARQQMIKGGIKAENIRVIYNSLDYEETKKLRAIAVDENFFSKEGFFSEQLPALIFIGRLTPEKKIGLLIEAAAKLKGMGLNCNVLIVGDGPERNKLELLAKEQGINHYFYGACYDEYINAKLIANSDLCVSPGNVGLTAIHALSYGTPVCTHNNFTAQMPEFEAIEEGKTGCFFDWAEKDIAETIQKWFFDNPDREKVRRDCYAIIDEKYNPAHQGTIMRNMLKQLAQ